MAEPTIDVVLEKIISLREDIQGLRTMLKEMAFSQQEALVMRMKIDQSVQAAHRRLDIYQPKVEALDKQLNTMQDMLRPLIITNRVMAFLASALILSVIGLVWSLITGQAQLVFP